MKFFIKTGFILLVCLWIVACGESSEYNRTQGKSNKKETFTHQETDVIQMGDRVKNIEVMEQFVEDSTSEKESEIRYVVIEQENKDPIAVYTLNAVTDEKADESWIKISRDYRFDTEGHDLIKSQQCSSVSKDTERGVYYLNECFHTWEIKLMPTSEQNNKTSDFEDYKE